MRTKDNPVGNLRSPTIAFWYTLWAKFCNGRYNLSLSWSFKVTTPEACPFYCFSLLWNQRVFVLPLECHEPIVHKISHNNWTTRPLSLSHLHRPFISWFLLQTLTTVLTIYAVMVDRARMVSTVTLVTAYWDLLEVTAKQVHSKKSRQQSWGYIQF